MVVRFGRLPRSIVVGVMSAVLAGGVLGGAWTAAGAGTNGKSTPPRNPLAEIAQLNQLEATHPASQLQAEVDQASAELAQVKQELAQISGVLPAASDEVSAAIAKLFGTYAQEYQALTAQAATFHEQFVKLMNAAGAAYAQAENAHATTNTTKP